jgi:hypothetical protein
MGQVLAWVRLLLVASTTAYGLQLSVEALVPSAAATTQVAPATFTRTVLIVAVDPATGDREQAECAVHSDSFSSDVLLVDASDFFVVSRACSRMSASGVRP